MAVLKYEFKTSVTQSHKTNDLMISRLLFVKLVLKHKPVHKILNMVPVLIARSLANVLSVLYMHYHYCVDCSKTLNGLDTFQMR